MKNIITNSCVGGYIYRDYLKFQYNNPFIWTSIDFDSFTYLIENFKNINFYNFYIKNNNHLIVDRKINVHFVHCIKDEKQNEIIKNNNNIYYNNIEKCIINTYLNRLSRMNVFNDTIFMYCHSFNYLSNKEIERIKHIKTNYKIYCFDKNLKCDYKFNNIKFVKSDIIENNRMLTNFIMNYNDAEISSIVR